MSRKKTVAWARNNPAPIQKTYNCIMGIITRKNLPVRGVRVINITMRSAPREKRKFTNSLVTEARVKIYLGTYIFFKIHAFCTTDTSALEVALLIKEKSINPIRRYIGKY